MKSFNDWMSDNNPGNYSSIAVDDLPTHLVPSDVGRLNTKPHVTLMYSKGSHVPQSQVADLMSKYDISGTKANVTGVEAFPDSDNPGMSAMVLTLEHPELQKLHDALCAAGCKHSFNPFKAHATLLYNVPSDKVEDIKSSLEPKVVGTQLTLGGISNDIVKKDWVNTLNKV